jgi:hypothetical protein
MGKACSPHGEENASIILVDKPEEKRPFGRPRHRWMNNNKISIIQTGLKGVNWTYLAQASGGNL